MKTYVCDYAISNPNSVIYYIERTFLGSSAVYNDMDEDRFEICVYDVSDLNKLDVAMKKYLYNE